MGDTTPLEQLRAAGTVVIADTGDFAKIKQFNPSEGTTNPSLLYLAVQDPAYYDLVQAAVAYARSQEASVPVAERLSGAVDFLAVQFGTQIYKLTGRISTEVDASLSFDTRATVASALRILELYEMQGVPREAVRIKISATWEGIQAARILQEDHRVSCLITVVFSLVQAIAAAEAGADAVAPYVGRLADWGKRHGIEGDLGIKTVSRIQNYLRKFGYKTQVMAASFRSTTQVRDLAGVDLLTASPAILEALQKEHAPIQAKLTQESAEAIDADKVSYIDDEPKFRWHLNKDACAVEMSADAMRRFDDDTNKLKSILLQQM